MIKYSFIMPYFKRPDHLWNTLLSYRHHYQGRGDYEILIVADLAGGPEDADALNSVVSDYSMLPIIKMVSPVQGGVNPVVARNTAAFQARGKYLVNTNPECFHESNVLACFDKILRGEAPADWGPSHPLWNAPSAQNKWNKPINTYIICSCVNVEFAGRAGTFADLSAAKRLMWYDHPHHNNRMLHWCSCLSRRFYMAIGGFDEKYHDLVGYDDDDFKQKILTIGIPVVYSPDIVVCHINHDRGHQDENARPKALAYYREKWER